MSKMPSSRHSTVGMMHARSASRSWWRRVAVACAVNRPRKAELAREPLALISDVFLVRLPAVGEVGVDDQELQQLRALFAEHPKMLGIHVAEPTHAKKVARTPRSQTFSGASERRRDQAGHRYRAMATSLEFDGHIAWAEAMP